MKIPDKKTRDQWRNKANLCSSEIVKLLDAVDALEDKVAGLEDTLEMERWESMQRSERDDL